MKEEIALDRLDPARTALVVVHMAGSQRRVNGAGSRPACISASGCRRSRMNNIVKIFGAASWLALAALVGPIGAAAQEAPRSQTAAATDITAHVKATYVRVILPHSAAAPLIEHYTKDLGGRVAFEFDYPSINARIVGLTSGYGNLSAEFTDHPESFDQWRRDTRLMYVVDDVPAMLKAVEQAGLKVVQPPTQSPLAWTGRFELSPGFVIEVIQWLPGKEP
jgi:hypothetical protein